MTQKHPNPRKRQDRLVVRELADEVLVYDLARDKAFCLSPAAAAVWKLCDGKSSPRELARALKLNDQVVWCALDQLGKDGLLDGNVKVPASLARLNRRQQLRTLGKVAAAAIPLVTAVTAPSAAEAATCTKSGKACVSSAKCCSGICFGGKCV
jgi:hypothetical protein